MKMDDEVQLVLLQPEPMSNQYGLVILNKERFDEFLSDMIDRNDKEYIIERITTLKGIITRHISDQEGLLNIIANGDTISLRKDVLVSEIDQVLNSQSLERMSYYLSRLLKSVRKVKTSKINDINLHRWKEYEEILTDSLWIFDRRDSSGAHLGWYWGNFIPQIPHQMMLRYTKENDWVLDPFLGSGTTLIECRRLNRNGIGIEINPIVLEKAKELIDKEPKKEEIITEAFVGDSASIDIKPVLERYGITNVQLVIMHPPYHDIIKFSNDKRDLSCAENVEEFLRMFGCVVDNTTSYLEKGRYLVVVIGDKYSHGEWVPLGFYCMQEVLKRGFQLKSIIVKNFEETRGKRNQKELWRYRALVGGFYVFKHEYILLFKKR